MFAVDAPLSNQKRLSKGALATLQQIARDQFGPAVCGRLIKLALDCDAKTNLYRRE